MKIKEKRVIDWYKGNGISSDSWNSYSELVKGMIAIETIADDWPEVNQMLETGIPEQAVLLYFDPQKCGLNIRELQERDKTKSYESLTTYCIQNTSSDNLKNILVDDIISVESVTVEKSQIQLECSAKGSDILQKDHKV